MAGQWSLNVNVAGVKPFEPGSFQRIATGSYAVDIVETEMEQKDPSKHPALRFDVKVADDGDFKGITTRVYIGTDMSKEGNRKHLRALLLGVGANPGALDSGNIQIDQSMFVGKRAYIYVEEAPEGATREDGKKQYDNRNFIAPAYYEKWRQDHAAGVTASQTQPQGPNGAGATPTGLAGLAGALGNAGAAAGGASFTGTGAAPQPGTGAPNLFGGR